MPGSAPGAGAGSPRPVAAHSCGAKRAIKMYVVQPAEGNSAPRVFAIFR